MKHVILMSMFALAGCATAHVEPQVITKIVEKPVPISCIPDNFPVAPSYVTDGDALTKASDTAERFRLLAAGWLQMKARLGLLEPVISNCRKK